MAFKQVGSMNPHGAPILRTSIITDSITTVQLDSVKLASGFSALGTAGALVFGHLMSHVDGDGVGLNTTGVAGAAIGTYVNSYLTASTNEATDHVAAMCDVSKNTLYSAELDAAIDTTTGSELAGYKFDLVDANTLDESTSTAATAQYASWGPDPENAAQVVVNIYESQVFGV